MGFTKLEAVNIMLDSIGESPVSSLSSGLPDAEAAETKLDEVNKLVQAKGWHQNTEYDIKLSPNADSNILVPADYLRVDTRGSDKETNVSVRRLTGVSMLYNVKDRTFVFTSSLQCDVIQLLDFEDLSLELSNYIAYRAARKFQEAQMQSTTLDGFTVRAEQEAYASLMDSECENEDLNILSDNAHCYYATSRHHKLAGR